MNKKVTTDAAAVVRIEGRVQGVGFRYFVYRQAKKHDVNGWVRNRSDGSVEACFEGPKPGVDEIVALCKKGPAGSNVKKVEVTNREPEGKYSTFQLRQGNN